MFIDANILENKSQLEADICILGAGAAGLVIANELAECSQLKVLVVEGGGIKPKPQSQTLYDGEISGLPYDAAKSRTFAFGGSTNCWGGFCRPLGQNDLRKRDWMAGSGWPLSHHDLADYYERAHRIWQLENNHYEPEYWINKINKINKQELKLLPIQDERIVTKVFQLAKSHKYGIQNRRKFERMQNVSIVLNAVATQIDVSDDGKKTTSIQAITSEKKHLIFRSKVFILATGGIENARLLLASNKKSKQGVGNTSDMVGRYFMEHPTICAGEVHFLKPFNPSFYDSVYSYFRLPAVASICISDVIQSEEKILGCKSYIEAVYNGEEDDSVLLVKDIYQQLRIMKSCPEELLSKFFTIAMGLPSVYKYIMGKRLRSNRFLEKHLLKCILEAEPIPGSRVTLSNEMDHLGRRKANLDWKISPLVQKTLLRSTQIIDQVFRANGLGYIELDPAILTGNWPTKIEGVNHHMGTTRMHVDPTKGVVDINCKVNGVQNLYIAGSSVFPTPGVDSPTITLTALSLRLADHLKTM